MSFAARFRAFVNHPTGPKTTHFWGPVANWGFVVAVRLFLPNGLIRDPR
jgi:mitochondrial pyruvate carrier 1